MIVVALLVALFFYTCGHEDGLKAGRLEEAKRQKEAARSTTVNDDHKEFQ